MRDHPIPPVTEPLQYRAIGIVRGLYMPKTPDQFTRGHLVGVDGVKLESVVLGRVLSLMRRHLILDQPHLWVVYPRSRESDYLHLQIAGIWEPSTLSKDIRSKEVSANVQSQILDTLPEGDDYFSVRGELIYTKPDTEDIVLRIRQRPRLEKNHPLPFKIHLKGKLSMEHLRKFVSLDVRRERQELRLENHTIVGDVPSRGEKKSNSKKINLTNDKAKSKNAKI